MKVAEIEFLDIQENQEYVDFIEKVLYKCFELEDLLSKEIYVSIILTTPSHIRSINKEYRNIDKETDVLSFPMFEKYEINDISQKEVLGDIVISVSRVKNQAVEFGHSFERELSYMVVHGFYHLMGYDHIEENDKDIMRAKEEEVLRRLEIFRD